MQLVVPRGTSTLTCFLQLGPCKLLIFFLFSLSHEFECHSHYLDAILMYRQYTPCFSGNSYLQIIIDTLRDSFPLHSYSHIHALIIRSACNLKIFMKATVYM